MAKSIEEIVSTFSADRQERIKQESDTLADEYRNLMNFRKALGLTQEQVAGKLQISQENVSRLEKRKDMHLSTLRKYVEALGGRLELHISIPAGNQTPGQTTKLKI